MDFFFLFSWQKQDWAAVTFQSKGICAITVFIALLSNSTNLDEPWAHI